MTSARTHRYDVRIEWTGNTGSGTSSYRAYERSHEISVPHLPKPQLPASSDPAFRGSRDRWNPEELLVASLSSCHQLWYLHLASEAGVVVLAYEDEATGVMEESSDGGGRFTRVTVRPRVTISRASDAAIAESLHERAHALCFIANSVNFPVACEPTTVRDEGDRVHGG